MRYIVSRTFIKCKLHTNCDKNQDGSLGLPQTADISVGNKYQCTPPFAAMSGHAGNNNQGPVQAGKRQSRRLACLTVTLENGHWVERIPDGRCIASIGRSGSFRTVEFSAQVRRQQLQQFRQENSMTSSQSLSGVLGERFDDMFPEACRRR